MKSVADALGNAADAVGNIADGVGNTADTVGNQFIEYKGRKYKDGKQGRSVIFLVYLSEIFYHPIGEGKHGVYL